MACGFVGDVERERLAALSLSEASFSFLPLEAAAGGSPIAMGAGGIIVKEESLFSLMLEFNLPGMGNLDGRSITRIRSNG